MSYKEASGAVGPADQQQPAVPEVTDVTLEAARKQKIHNLKLKASCLSNEEFIQDLHVSDWSETQKQKLLAAHEKAQELLSSVEGGTKWNLTEAYDIKKLMRVCGLQLSVRELYKPEDKPHFMEVVALKKTLNELKQHHNKTRTVSFTGTIDNAIAKLEKIEDELRRSQLDASEMAQVPVAVLKNLEECMNVTVVQTALLGNEEQIKAQLAAIEKAKEIRNVAIADGEMAIAEEQYYIKAQLLEHLVELVADKFRIIGQTEDDQAVWSHPGCVKKSFQDIYDHDAKRRLATAPRGRPGRRTRTTLTQADMRRGGDEARFMTVKEEAGKVHPGEPDRQDERGAASRSRACPACLGIGAIEEVKRRIGVENDREEKREGGVPAVLMYVAVIRSWSWCTPGPMMRCIGMMEESWWRRAAAQSRRATTRRTRSWGTCGCRCIRSTWRRSAACTRRWASWCTRRRSAWRRLTATSARRTFSWSLPSRRLTRTRRSTRTPRRSCTSSARRWRRSWRC
ncbi:Paraflagellar rod protein 2 [Trypanosoma cruzi]|uniref:Paraflagellar rod protein 2 n=1 Tax=Trypanosoma cruzi TaxID=5693 RepID=A0A7J6XKF2_TRYCR|nr:Paraflagellar rod protein 2 [Trypanosoma cruzi]